MDLEFTPQDEAFRAEVRQFLDAKCPERLCNSRKLGRDELLEWHRIVYAQGWIAPSWPVEYGGTGWSVTQRYIWDQETARKGTPPILPFGIMMVGPVIYTFGNEAQKAHYLPRILSGDDWWCQGYSEPGSGSDLASLRTKAIRTGDGQYYLVNGMKTWTTLAQHADWIFCLVRTDPGAAKQQEGISFLLIDMKSPGVTVRPIITIDGGHEVNEVYFDDVKVPVHQLIGEENQGWTYAKFLLGHERSGIAGVARSKQGLERLRALAEMEVAGGRPLSEDPDFQRKMAELEIDLLALEFTELRTLASEQAGRGPGPESSILKIAGSEIQQRLSELALEAVGYYGMPFDEDDPEGSNEPPVGPDHADGAAPRYFNMRKTSIYGGSNEIQRNIIAKMVLGL